MNLLLLLIIIYGIIGIMISIVAMIANRHQSDYSKGIRILIFTSFALLWPLVIIAVIAVGMSIIKNGGNWE